MTKLAPLCRYCGKPIAKVTCTVWIDDQTNKARPQPSLYSRHIYPEQRPQTIADCRRLTNLQVITVQRHKAYNSTLDEYKDAGIRSFNEWDGETYRGSGQGGKHFCSGQCALDFGKLMAEGGHCTSDYNKARAAQQKKAAAS